MTALMMKECSKMMDKKKKKINNKVFKRLLRRKLKLLWIHSNLKINKVPENQFIEIPQQEKICINKYRAIGQSLINPSLTDVRGYKIYNYLPSAKLKI